MDCTARLPEFDSIEKLKQKDVTSTPTARGRTTHGTAHGHKTGFVSSQQGVGKSHKATKRHAGKIERTNSYF